MFLAAFLAIKFNCLELHDTLRNGLRAIFLAVMLIARELRKEHFNWLLAQIALHLETRIMALLCCPTGEQSLILLHETLAVQQ